MACGDFWKLQGFIVEERVVDYDLENESGTWYPTTNSSWSYLRDGSLFSYSPFTTDWNVKCYRGTPDDAIKFKPGNLAMFFDHDDMFPVKIVEKPFTEKEWIEKIKKYNGKEILSDSSDDCYLAVSVNGHHLHPATERLFPVNVDIPHDIIKKINASEKKYLKGN